MPIPKPYHTTETAVRVSEAYWFDCPENREQMHELAWFHNGDSEWPRSKPLTIYVMDEDNLGCVGFIDPVSEVISPKLAELMADQDVAEAA